jgi:hypothetical protein
MLALLSSAFAQRSTRRYFASAHARLRYELPLSSRGLPLKLDGYSAQLAAQLQEERFW